MWANQTRNRLLLLYQSQATKYPCFRAFLLKLWYLLDIRIAQMRDRPETDRGVERYHKRLTSRPGTEMKVGGWKYANFTMKEFRGSSKFSSITCYLSSTRCLIRRLSKRTALQSIEPFSRSKYQQVLLNLTKTPRFARWKASWKKVDSTGVNLPWRQSLIWTTELTAKSKFTVLILRQQSNKKNGVSSAKRSCPWGRNGLKVMEQRSQDRGKREFRQSPFFYTHSR